MSEKVERQTLAHFARFLFLPLFPAATVEGLYAAYAGFNVSAFGSLIDAPASEWLFGLLGDQPMFIRECYSTFFDYAMEIRRNSRHTSGCIFVGNPGIGKSCWLNYALIRLLQANVTVFVERMSKGDVWLFKDGKCFHEKQGSKTSTLIDEIDNDKEAVYLFDPDAGKGEPTFPVQAFTIIASSPNKANYKEFNKAMAAHTIGERRRYFPCWSLDELAACQRLEFACLVERFELWGGVPRLVFESAQETLKADLETSIYAVSMELIQRYIHTPEIHPDDQKRLSHLLVQYRVGTPHIKGQLDFASEMIGRMIIEETLRRDAQMLVGHYRWCAQEKWKGVYAGHVWEHLCHYLLPEGNLQLQPLEPEAKNSKNVLASGAITVEVGDLQAMQGIIAAGKYFKPSTTNFPVIDAAAMDGKIVYGFQMTLARRHPPKGQQLVTILKALPADVLFHLVWVVDPGKDGNFAKQTLDMSGVDEAGRSMLKNVKQWRLPLKFPSTDDFARVLEKYKQQ